jgi:hypothetical protein
MAESNGADRHVHVYSVGKWTRNARVVTFDVGCSAVALPAWICRPAARARVRRAYQGETRGKRDGLRRARDYNLGILHRLSESIEHVSRKFQHLVEKQHAVVSKTDLARPRKGASTDQTSARDRVMGRPERPHSFGYVTTAENAGH